MGRIPHLSRISTLTLFSALLVPATGGADDTALFSTSAPPNVLILQDNSGSMNNLVWHPAYDPTQTPSCANWNNAAEYQSSSNVTLTRCGKTRTVYVDAAVSPAVPTRYEGRYLNWYFSAAADAYVSQIASTTNGTNGACAQGLGAPATYGKYRRSRITAAKDILRNVICDVNAVGKVRFGLAQFRLAGGSNDPNGGYVLVPGNDYKWDDDNNPATPDVPYSYSLNGVAKTHQQHLMDAIKSFDGETWTPLGESLFQLYTYFMSRTTANIPLGRDGVTRFPAYQYVTAEANNGGRGKPPDAGVVPGSPAQYSCQKTFVVLITDGEPTMDNFATTNNTADKTNLGFGNFVKLIGDFNPDNANPENNGSETQANLFCSGCNSATYLDDVAKYMHERDFRPDMPGAQTIDVYTVGFTTGDAANALLQKTAAVAGGRFYSSNSPDQLDDAIVDAITDIIQKSQSFTSATVPASRTTEGNNFYASYFLPFDGTSFWEGHLKNFEFTKSGRIQDTNGDCALADPGAPTTCEAGALLTNAPAFWDAGEVVPAPAARTLYVSRGGATAGSVPPAFSTSVSAADLTLTFPPATPYVGSLATNATQLAAEIVQYVRGCVFGSSPCVSRAWRLADIFHSNPLVVGPPNAAINESSYRSFAVTYKHRKKLIYAGSNGGFLHAFRAGTWDGSATPPAYTRGDGVEQFGFMPYPVRKTIKNLPIDPAPRDFYYVDGPPQAADVWLYPTPTTPGKVAGDWHTLLVGGLRQGGRGYYALDVTNPDGVTGGPSFPAYLWEFPCEASSCDAWRPYMGETWSEPIMTRVKVAVNTDNNNGLGYERWVAIVAAGYDKNGDPNDASNYKSSVSNCAVAVPVSGYPCAGRALLMIDLASGQILAARKFDPTAAAGTPEANLKYTFASTPAVFDLNHDGFADVVYIGDLGGQMWKWVINGIGVDPIHGSGSVSQPAWELKRFLVAPPVIVGTTTYYKSYFFPPTGTLVGGHLWLAFGTGQRNNLKLKSGNGDYTDEDDRLFVVKDLDPLERETTALPTIDPDASPTQLDDVTNVDGCPTSASPYGYYIRGRDGEKFITNEVIFLGSVLASSFIPVASTDPCTAGGNAFLYSFKLSCAEGSFPAGGSPAANRRVSIGAGLPNRPRVSVGATAAGASGGGGGGCANQVLVVTSDGTSYNKSAGCLPSTGVSIGSWRESQ